MDTTTVKPSVSQKQADMMQHSAHDPEYSLSRSVPEKVAQDQHAANVALGKWFKSEDGPCPKCNPQCEHPGNARTLDGYCGYCGLHESLFAPAGSGGQHHQAQGVGSGEGDAPADDYPKLPF